MNSVASNLQSILDQDDSMLRYYRRDDGTWAGQILHVSNGTIVMEIHGDSILQVQNSYTKWLYSPMELHEVKLPRQNADNM